MKKRLWRQKNFECEPVVLFKGFKLIGSEFVKEITELSKYHLQKLAQNLADPSRTQYALCVSFDQEGMEILKENVAKLEQNSKHLTTDEVDGAHAVNPDLPTVFR